MKIARSRSATFASEAQLCRAFISDVEEKGICAEWKVYAETAGFDILLVRKIDGAQIGVEAKLSLNLKVLMQSRPEGVHWNFVERGPDYRAVLVPNTASGGLEGLCAALGITVIRQRIPGETYKPDFYPSLPCESYGMVTEWHEWAPMQRCALPDYIPDVTAGAPSPVSLTHWKIAAIKLAIILEDRPVTRADFKALKLSPARWTDPFTKWLIPGVGGYIRGPGLPNFLAQHPRNYEEIRADRAKWMPKSLSPSPTQLSLGETSQP